MAKRKDIFEKLKPLVLRDAGDRAIKQIEEMAIPNPPASKEEDWYPFIGDLTNFVILEVVAALDRCATTADVEKVREEYESQLRT